MSVQATAYVIQGVKIPYVNDTYEKYEKHMDSVHAFEEGFDPNEVSVIYDGMNGKYILIGFILAKGIETRGTPLTRLKIRNRLRVAKAINAAIDGLSILPEEVNVFALTHYT